MAEYDHLFKVILVGHINSGKTSLIKRFIDDEFNDSFKATTSVEFREKTLEHQGRYIKLQICDTPGHEGLNSITTEHYRRCHGVMFVFDVTDQASYDRIFDLIRDVERYAPKNVSRLMVGNKCDMTVVRCITEEEATSDAKFHDMNYIDTSAEERINVSQAFTSLCERMLKRMSRQAAGKSSKSVTGNGLADVSDKPKKNGHDKKDGDVPKWAGKLINEMSEMKEQLKNVHHLEATGETLCKKVEELETKVNRLQTRKVNFKAAQSKSVTN